MYRAIKLHFRDDGLSLENPACCIPPVFNQDQYLTAKWHYLTFSWLSLFCIYLLVTVSTPKENVKGKAWEINWSPLTCSGYFCSELFWHHDLMACGSHSSTRNTPPSQPPNLLECSQQATEVQFLFQRGLQKPWLVSPGLTSAPCRPSVVLKSLLSRHKANCLENHLWTDADVPGPGHLTAISE